MEGRLRMRRRRRRTVSSGTVNNDIGLRNNVLMMRARETTGDERKRQDN